MAERHHQMDARLTQPTVNRVTGTLRMSWCTVENIKKQEVASCSATPREIVPGPIHRQHKKSEFELADACQDLFDAFDAPRPGRQGGELQCFL